MEALAITLQALFKVCDTAALSGLPRTDGTLATPISDVKQAAESAGEAVKSGQCVPKELHGAVKSMVPLLTLWARTDRPEVPETSWKAPVTGAVAAVLKVFRNCCAFGHEWQAAVIPLLAVVVEVIQVGIVLGSTQQSAHTVVKLGIQLVGNATVRFENGQRELWKAIFPDVLLQLLLHSEEGVFDILCMPILSCITECEDRRRALCTSAGGWRIMALILERSEPADGSTDGDNPVGATRSSPRHEGSALEWAVFLIQHCIRSACYEELYNGLGQIVASRRQSNSPQGAVSDDTGDRPIEAAAGATEVHRGEVAKLMLLKWTWGIILERLASREQDSRSAAGEDFFPLATLHFLVDRYRLLAYLGQDQDWWRNPANSAAAAVLATVIGLLGDLALLNPKVRALLGARGVLDTSVELLCKMKTWDDSAVTRMKQSAEEASVGDDGGAASLHGKMKSDPSTLSPPAEPNSANGLQSAFGVKRDVVKLVGNVVFRCKSNQDKLRELEGIPELLSLFFFEANNPFLREWAIVAVRNVCEGNSENQQVISAIESTPKEVVNSDDLHMYGMEVVVDPTTGKLKVKNKQASAKSQ